jgi:amino acid transporter
MSEPAPEHEGGNLEPDAIGLGQGTVIGMASSAPAASIALTLAPLAAATAYGSGAIIVLTAIPMLLIALAYRRLNLWNQNCGASYEWVGRSMSPYLGFMVGWFMIAGYVIATVSGVEVLGPSVLAVFGASGSNTWGNIGIATGIGLAMVIIAVIGIRITARVQVGMAVVEYAILVGFAVAGLVAVADHWTGTLHLTSGWLSPAGIGGHGDVTAGFLIAVFIFTGWDGAIYVNEETKVRGRNPGTAAVLAVTLLCLIYLVTIVGLQGTVSPSRLRANGASALVYTAQALGGGGWSKVMALSLALSVIATTGTGIVLTARIVYSMARDRVLPRFLARVPGRYATPASASIVIGIVVMALTWVYLLATSVENAFTDVVDVAGILFALFYVATALATLTYYRKLLVSSTRELLLTGVLPLLAAGFLCWVVVKSLLTAPAAQLWSLLGIAAVGLALMTVARFLLRAPFFRVPREHYGAGSAVTPGVGIIGR